MKLLMIVLMSLFFSQSFAAQKLVELTADSDSSGKVSYSKTKYQGESSEDATYLSFSVNGAYQLGESSFMAGLRGAYGIGRSDGYRASTQSLLVGGYYNFDPKFNEAFYVSLHTGLGLNIVGGNDTEDSRNEFTETVATFGKRFPIKMFGSENITYSPSVSYSIVNFTESTSYSEYRNDLSIDFLKFAAVF